MAGIPRNESTLDVDVVMRNVTWWHWGRVPRTAPHLSCSVFSAPLNTAVASAIYVSERPWETTHTHGSQAPNGPIATSYVTRYYHTWKHLTTACQCAVYCVGCDVMYAGRNIKSFGGNLCLHLQSETSFCPEDYGSGFFRNFDNIAPHYTLSHPKRKLFGYH